jgi:hypothetical protein
MTWAKRKPLRCPRGKKRYGTEETALMVLGKLREQHRDELRHYRCEACDGWHLTSQRKTGYGTMERIAQL